MYPSLWEHELTIYSRRRADKYLGKVLISIIGTETSFFFLLLSSFSISPRQFFFFPIDFLRGFYRGDTR